MHDISATISVSGDKCKFILLSVLADKKIWPINNALFPSKTLQMCAVRHGGFEMLEI